MQVVRCARMADSQVSCFCGIRARLAGYAFDIVRLEGVEPRGGARCVGVSHPVIILANEKRDIAVRSEQLQPDRIDLSCMRKKGNIQMCICVFV